MYKEFKIIALVYFIILNNSVYTQPADPCPSESYDYKLLVWASKLNVYGPGNYPGDGTEKEMLALCITGLLIQGVYMHYTNIVRNMDLCCRVGANDFTQCLDNYGVIFLRCLVRHQAEFVQAYQGEIQALKEEAYTIYNIKRKTIK